jgi:hypothetical protein
MDAIGGPETRFILRWGPLSLLHCARHMLDKDQPYRRVAVAPARLVKHRAIAEVGKG